MGMHLLAFTKKEKQTITEMKIYFPIIFCLLIFGCSSRKNQSSQNQEIKMTQNDLKNEKLRNYSFLKSMYSDTYFPNFLVDKGKAILVDLCFQIEKENPKNLSELYKLTHAATNKFNDLENEFGENGSEIETGARESIGGDFFFIAKAYGYDADIEELIATRYW